MLNGFYRVEVRTNLNNRGYCVLMGLGGRLWGGDAACTFSGHYRFENNVLTLQLGVKRECTDTVSVFGDIDEYHVTCRGRPKGNFDQIVLMGQVDENPSLIMTILLTLKSTIPSAL